LTVADLVQATGGTLLRGDAAALVRQYGIDSRRIEPGGVFFALRGEHGDGHDYLADAASRGARAAVVERAPEGEVAAPPVLIRVEDGVRALGACGRLVRERLAGRRFIAVTGSNGKTTTKELIAAGASGSRRVHRTPGNYNNQLGVPLSLLACPDDAETVVLELGMSGYGEIAALTTLVDPDVGLITNVRAAHLQAFNSLDDIAAAKGEMFAVLRPEATAVVNLDDAHVRVQATRHSGPQITFGQHPAADVCLLELTNRFVPGAALTIRHAGRTLELALRLGGAHSAFDALAAVAALVAAGHDLEPALAKMEAVEPGPGRGRIHRLERDVMLVDDSYNSSPSALASVLETLRLSQPPGRRVLVMGDMLELGPLEAALHREAGKRAVAAGVGALFAIGPLSKNAADAARRGGLPIVQHWPDSARAAAEIGAALEPGDLVVVKGSRGMHLERVVQALTSVAGAA
jgi:UDP-N-acetylmuramoyl-tripeptide--D-alanyl-D-alanine ligase